MSSDLYLNRDPSCNIKIPVSPDILRHWAGLLESRLKNIDPTALWVPTPEVDLQIQPGILLVCNPKALPSLPSIIKTQQPLGQVGEPNSLNSNTEADLIAKTPVDIH